MATGGLSGKTMVASRAAWLSGTGMLTRVPGAGAKTAERSTAGAICCSASMEGGGGGGGTVCAART